MRVDNGKGDTAGAKVQPVGPSDGGGLVVSRSQRRAMIDREEPKLSLVRQCALLGISRSSLYYLPTEAGAEDMELMALIDQQYLKTPFYGSRRMTAWRRNHGHQVNRKRVRRLMQLIGLEAIYRRPNTSKPEHAPVYLCGYRGIVARMCTR